MCCVEVINTIVEKKYKVKALFKREIPGIGAEEQGLPAAGLPAHGKRTV